MSNPSACEDFQLVNCSQFPNASERELARKHPVTERDALLRRFRSKISPNTDFNRQLVSFQANRQKPIYNWFRYKEGFSAEMVKHLIRGQFEGRSGVLLDPFAGAGTALFTGRSLGWKTIGIEILPIGKAIWEARHLAHLVDLEKFRRAVEEVESCNWLSFYDREFRFRHVPITERAFPERNERALAGFAAYCACRIRDDTVRRLFLFAGMCVLEAISYTRKDGQYLRWDHRSGKNSQASFDKGRIFSFSEAISVKLESIYRDIAASRRCLFDEAEPSGSIGYRVASCLEILPTVPAGSVDLLLTSPPYCNRYDYTRTYALELAWLGLNDEKIKRLRQQMLSCTVENRDKSDSLKQLYARIGQPEVFEYVHRVFRGQRALHEVLGVLEKYRSTGNLNNSNLPRMVHNYFFEMCFVIYEFSRILGRGGKVVMVNDNVRYAGEEVPVDLILSSIAEEFGLMTRHIWKLQRGKGNSSQQMGNHGRAELRKCVYVWEK
jgi:hypothetical protein